MPQDNMELEVEAYLRRRYERQVADIEIVHKEDLDLKNHLSGLQKKYLKVSFDTAQQLVEVKRDLLHIVERNLAKFNALEAYESILAGKREQQRPQDCLDYVVDLREYDVLYHVRFAIDNDVRSGQWYNVSISSTDVILDKRTDLLQRAEVRVCAFDIETVKLPLKFPDAESDQIMMISYMVYGKGFLITNRECVGKDVEDLEYTSKPEFEGYFKVTNVNNEVELLRKWFSHMQELKPGIYVTYNGDFFDWPFIERRASHHGIKLNEELGFCCDHNQGECRAKFVCHLDCFSCVKRDSYLPQGSHGLKVMQKVFALLLTDLRRLGAKIIYADFSKVVIDTGKFDLSAAKAYCESLFAVMGSRDIFESILLEPVHYWHSLLFMDQYNYAGIRATGDEISCSEVTIEPKWSVARHLPEYIQRDFIVIIFDPWKFALEKKRGSSESLETEMVEYLKEQFMQIGSDFESMLYRKVDDIKSHMKEINVSDASRVSGQAPKGDYAFEFIQMISAVLALDRNVHHDVLEMRKNLLKYIKVKELAAEAGFIDPGPSFILPNVACSNCDAYRDLDLGRDPALLTEKEWSCADPQCGKIYDKEHMENLLVQMVRQRDRMYQLQDLVCNRCNQVKAAHLTEQCEGSGSFRCKESGSEFYKRMEIFLDIAKR